MQAKPNKAVKARQKPGKSGKNVPRETIGDPKITYVYRKDAFKKVKIA